MFTKLITKAVVAFVMTAMVNLMVGCSNEQATMPDSVGGENVAGYVTVAKQEVLIDDDADKQQVLSRNLSISNVVAAKLWLEDQGYNYVDTNSLVLIEHEYEYVPVDRDNEDERNGPALKLTPDERRLARADTVVWLAFENPTHDLANHTALLTLWENDGQAKTILMELDVSTEMPTVMREGSIIDGEFVPGDVGLTSWLSCFLGGLAGGATACLMSNCLYGKCIGIAAGASAVGCAVSELLS